MEEVEERFKLKEPPAPCEEVLGIDVDVTKNDAEGREVWLTMEDYALEIHRTAEEHLMKTIRKAEVPLTKDVRRSIGGSEYKDGQVSWAFGEISAQDDKRKALTGAQKIKVVKQACQQQFEEESPEGRVPPALLILQMLMGMLLWYMRCCRPDLGFPVSTLASVITQWTWADQVQLENLVGYVLGTARMGLRMVGVRSDKKKNLVVGGILKDRLSISERASQKSQHSVDFAD